MKQYTERTCPKCGQRLRFPQNVGGVLMACPSCGNKFSSDFKLGDVKSTGRQSFLVRLFELPDRILQRIVRYFTARH